VDSIRSVQLKGGRETPVVDFDSVDSGSSHKIFIY
jgi:hypothetical protein